MTPEGPEETDADPELIGRATTLIALTQGRTVGESAELLRFCASARGMSLHALAVAVLSGEPGDQPLLVRSARCAGAGAGPRRRARPARRSTPCPMNRPGPQTQELGDNPFVRGTRDELIAEVVVAMTDTLRDDFTSPTLLYTLTTACVGLLDVDAAGILLVDDARAGSRSLCSFEQVARLSTSCPVRGTP